MPFVKRLRPGGLWLLAGLGVAACGGTEVVEIGEGPPARLVVANAAAATGFIGNVLAPPAIRVLDAQGRILPGVTVGFRVEGGGQLAAVEAVTDDEGIASPGGWRLGPEPGTQRLIAEARGATVAYSVAAATPPAPGFSIVVIYEGDARTQEQHEAIATAVRRWGELVIGDLPDMRLPETVPQECPVLLLYPSLNVDDLLLIVSLTSLPVGTIGTTVLCHRRPNGLPSVASIKINPAAAVYSAGLVRVMEHEIAHALGFGTIWSDSLLKNRNGDLRFLGRSAEAAYLLAFGAAAGPVGGGVPVEMTGGPAHARSHWRESVLHRELLTPYSQTDDQPLSAITVSSLRDLGYVVDDRSADPFTPTAASSRVASRRP